MHGFESFPLHILAGCFALAFVIELFLNRNPWILGLVTPVVAFFVLLVVLFVAWGPIDIGSIFLGLLMFVLAPIGSLTGAGLGRLVRLWFSHQRQSIKKRSN